MTIWTHLKEMVGCRLDSPRRWDAESLLHDNCQLLVKDKLELATVLTAPQPGRSHSEGCLLNRGQQFHIVEV